MGNGGCPLVLSYHLLVLVNRSCTPSSLLAVSFSLPTTAAKTKKERKLKDSLNCVTPLPVRAHHRSSIEEATNANRAKAMGAKAIVTTIYLVGMLLFTVSAATAASAGVRPVDVLVDTTDRCSDNGNNRAAAAAPPAQLPTPPKVEPGLPQSKVERQVCHLFTRCTRCTRCTAVLAICTILALRATHTMYIISLLTPLTLYTVFVLMI